MDQNKEKEWRCNVCGGRGTGSKCLHCGSSKEDSDYVAGAFEKEETVDEEKYDDEDSHSPAVTGRGER